MIREQRGNQNKQGRFVPEIAAGEVPLIREIAGLSMALHRDPVIQSLKGQLRIRRDFDFNYNEPSFSGYRQEVDNVPLLTDKTWNLWVDMPDINERQKLTDITNDIGLQPLFFVSPREQMATAVPPQLRKLLNDATQGLPKR